MINLTLLDGLKSDSVISRLLYLLHELVLLLGQIVDSGQHLFLVFFRLSVLFSSDTLGALGAPGVVALFLGEAHAGHADFGGGAE